VAIDSATYPQGPVVLLCSQGVLYPLTPENRPGKGGIAQWRIA